MELVLGMMVLLGALAVVPGAIADAIATARASSAGRWDVIDKDRQRRATAADKRADRRERMAKAWAQRRQERHTAAGGEGQYRPGFKAYAGDVYHGWWEDRLERRNAKRATRAPFDPNRPTLRSRLDGAVRTKVGQLRERRNPPAGKAGSADASKPASPNQSGNGQAKPGSKLRLATNTIKLPGTSTPTKRATAGKNGSSQDPKKTLTEQEKKIMTQPTKTGGPTGETTGVVSGARQAGQIRLSATNLRESTLAQIGQMEKAIDAQAAAAAEMDMDPATQADLAQARESLAALRAAVTGTGDEVDSAMTTVEKDWSKHLEGVDLNARVGGVAKKQAYSGN